MELVRFEEILSKPDLLDDVVRQIRKDLNLSDDEIVWRSERDDAYDLFHKDLKHEVIRLDKANQLQAILYRVDVSESKMKKLGSGGSGEWYDHLTDLILNRELKKVITRRFYSKK